MNAIGSYIVVPAIGAWSALCLLLIQLIPRPWVFFSLIAVWIGGSLAIHRWLRRETGRRIDAAIMTVATIVAFVALSSMIESWIVRWFLWALCAFLMAVAHLPPTITLATPHTQKTYRRVCTMIWVFDTYALVTAIFAFPYFFPTIPLFGSTVAIVLWMQSVFMGLLCAAAAYMIWRMYYAITISRARLLMAVVALLVVELSWTVAALPFGYLVSGFLVTWAWYLLQLFLRFHSSAQGIVWGKQWKFLISNAVLFVVFLYFVRWV